MFSFFMGVMIFLLVCGVALVVGAVIEGLINGNK